MTWLWIVGAVVLVAGAVLPALLSRRRAGRREFVAARDRARSARSRLEWALDRAGEEQDPAAVEQARRCLTLAGSALAGSDTAEAFRQSESWCRQGLDALGAIEAGPHGDPDGDADPQAGAN